MKGRRFAWSRLSTAGLAAFVCPLLVNVDAGWGFGSRLQAAPTGKIAAVLDLARTRTSRRPQAGGRQATTAPADVPLVAMLRDLL